MFRNTYCDLKLGILSNNVHPSCKPLAFPSEPVPRTSKSEEVASKMLGVDSKPKHKQEKPNDFPGKTLVF